MTNRNPVKQLFITFPHSNVDKVQFRDDLLRFEPDYYNVCEEKHKDGSPHLHAIVRFKNKYSKAFVLKYFKEKYPDDYKRIDIKPVRSIKNAIQYLSKEDTTPLISGEFTSNRNPTKNQHNKFARDLGYTNVADLLSKLPQEEQDMAEFKKVIHSRWMKMIDLQIIPEWKLLKIYENLFSKNQISKDDMTFLKEQLLN